MRRCGCLVGSIATLMLAAACGRESNAVSGAESAPQISVSTSDVVRVERATLERGPVLTGRLTPEEQSTLSAEVNGPVMTLTADVGQRVRRGNVLARIEDSALRDQLLSGRLAVSSANSALHTARRDAERLQALLEAGAVSAQQVQNARQAVTAAQAQRGDAEARLALAKEQLGHTVVRAPISGTVSERPINAGDVVQIGQPLITIVDLRSMRLEGSIPTADVGHVMIGDPVHFEVTGYGDRLFKGHVTRISPTADPTTGQIRLFVSIPNIEGELVAGVFARGRVGVEQAAGLVIPAAALHEENGRLSVTTVRNGLVALEPVTVELRDPLTDRVLVSANLSPGDPVLLNSAQTLTEGTRVVLPTHA